MRPLPDTSFRNIATSCSGAKKLRTYSTAPSSAPTVNDSHVMRTPPHSTTAPIANAEMAIRAGSKVPNPDDAHVRVAVRTRKPAELDLVARLGAECLPRADARHRLDELHDDAGAVHTGAAVGGLRTAIEPAHQERERHAADQHDQAGLPVQDHQRDEGETAVQHTGDELGEAAGEELPDGLEIAGLARDDPPRRVLLVELQAQQLRVSEHTQAEVEQDVLRDPRGQHVVPRQQSGAEDRRERIGPYDEPRRPQSASSITAGSAVFRPMVSKSGAEHAETGLRDDDDRHAQQPPAQREQQCQQQASRPTPDDAALFPGVVFAVLARDPLHGAAHRVLPSLRADYSRLSRSAMMSSSLVGFGSRLASSVCSMLEMTARSPGRRCHQIGVSADHRDPPVLEQCDAVGECHGRRPMRHDERRRPREHPPQLALHALLRVDVQRRQRVVHHDHGGTRRDGTGERQPLALPAGEAQSLLPDHRRHTIGQLLDELCLRHLERLSRITRPASDEEMSRPSRPTRTFSRTVRRNSVASLKAVAIRVRSSTMDRSRISTPSSVTRPPVTSYRLHRQRLVRVVFPSR